LPERDPQNAIPKRTLESLFVRGLHADGPFTEILREVGYDIEDPLASYPRSVWRASLEVARHYYYEHLSYEESYRELGRKFAAGFVDSVLGRMLASMVPLLGPERVMTLLPYYIAVARPDITVKVKPITERRWRLEFTGPHPIPDFAAGIVEAGMRLANVEPHVQTAERPVGFDLVVTW
jgi:uncharacterized protein (TIGR02265 family)